MQSELVKTSDKIIEFILESTEKDRWDAFIICADALMEEKDYALAQTFLWCYKHKRRPKCNGVVYDMGYGWWWGHDDTSDISHRISDGLIAMSIKERDEVLNTYREEDSFRRAMERLCQVLLKKEIITGTPS